MAVIGCDKNHDNEDTDVTLGKISRIDVRSYSEEDDVKVVTVEEPEDVEDGPQVQ